MAQVTDNFSSDFFFCTSKLQVPCSTCEPVTLLYQAAKVSREGVRAGEAAACSQHCISAVSADFWIVIVYQAKRQSAVLSSVVGPVNHPFLETPSGRDLDYAGHGDPSLLHSTIDSNVGLDQYPTSKKNKWYMDVIWCHPKQLWYYTFWSVYMYIILHIYIYAYMYSMYTYRYQHGHGVANRNHVRFAVAAFAPVPGAEEAPSSKSAHFRTFYLHILHILYMYVIYIYCTVYTPRVHARGACFTTYLRLRFWGLGPT